MISNRTQLRSLGYSADAEGNIVCHRAGTFDARYLHERCGVVRVDLQSDSKPLRELVERLIVAADEPRALVGRSRNGGAVLLFKVGEYSDLPQSDGEGVFNLITREGERFTVTCASLGQAVNVDAYSWAKNRSPYEVSRDALAALYVDVGQRVVDWAFKDRCAYAPTAAEREASHRIAKIKQQIADGTLVPMDWQADDDERFLAENRDVGMGDALRPILETVRLRVFSRRQGRTESRNL